MNSGAFQHAALLYDDDADYLAQVSAFVRAGLAHGHRVLVAVPAERAGPLRDVLGPASGQVGFMDITEAGRNPGRLIGVVRDFVDSHPGRTVTVVGEPAWPTRSADEFREAARHEALANLALAGVPMSALCPYDAARLPASVLAAARQTHPLLVRPGGPVPSPAFLGTGVIPPACLEPLPPPPPAALALAYAADLAPVRDLAARYAAGAGLPPDRAGDLAVAASELAANTLAHTPGGGILRIWQAPGEVVFEIADRGWIRDPLAGRQRPPGEGRGYGLWVVHQLCDLVETRTGPGGTTTRCHLNLHR